MTQPLSLKEKIGYGFGDFASSMFWKIFSVYLLYYYTDVFGIAAGVVGTMFLITRIWDTALDPLIGILSDRTQTRWGKFRPYLLWVAVPFGLIGVLTFTAPEFSTTGKIVYAYVTYTLMMMVYSAINVPYASLMGVMSADTRERTTLSTFRFVFAFAGSILVLGSAESLVGFFSGGQADASSLKQGWQLSMSVYALIAVVLFYLTFAWTRERITAATAIQGNLKADLKDLAGNKPWFILLGAGVCTLIFNSLRDGSAIYYFKYYFEGPGAGMTLFGIPFSYSTLYLVLGQAANIAGVVLAKPVSDRIGKKNTFIGAMLVATLLSIVFYFCSPDETALVFSLQVLISICAGSIFPLLWSMYADIADYSEWKTGRRATGLIFSSSSMSQKLGWTLGGALTGWILALYGFQANAVQDAAAQTGIRYMMSLIPAAGSLLSVGIILFYKLSDTYMINLSKELTDRREIAQKGIN
ncbi:MFS transporter [Pedobacter yulinensis]|uniref:MFS transporter n=1 Tax=Pedobacter yulinensis TaxID=2126353 RepID=A0A2T3HJY0_9SPHI|nr:MFS transporter [Pedobacter yulinensis]PST82730.1 MFS transporter [Pedobacter yulinensis]